MRATKRFLSILLALCMLLSLLPGTVFAASKTVSFSDVKGTDWYSDSVEYAVEKGIMSGTGDNQFSPNAATTRGMLVTILYRMEGSPAVSARSFKDVQAGAYYANGVYWAAANGILTGYGDSSFGPNDPVTREQMAAILYRYFQYKHYVTRTVGDVTDYADGASVSSYAVEAMNWAVGFGVLSGGSGNRLNPASNATRAEVATILMRFDQAITEGSTRPNQGNGNTSSGGGQVQISTYTVTFDYNYGNKGTYETATVTDGQTVDSPAAPSRFGYLFMGWYTKASGGERYDFDDAVEQDLTLYARWMMVPVIPDGTTPGPEGTFTVTFETNGGSAVQSQTVTSGQIATKPTDPQKDGLIFGGWYLDNNVWQQPYQFSAPVTGDLTLYAKWGTGDNAEDPPSMEVNPDDVYILSSNITEADSSVHQIIFKVQSTLTVDSFMLYCGGISTNVALCDDGGYYINGEGDDIPNDGIYTGVYTLNGTETGTLSFTARATVGSTPIETESVNILFYDALTTAQISAMENVQTTIAKAMENAVNALGETATAEERTEARYQAVMLQLETLKQQGEITGLEGDPETGLISFVYADNGIEGGAMCSEYESGPASVDSAAESRTDSTGVRDSLMPYNTMSATDTEFEYISYKEKAIVLNYCDENDPEQERRVEAYSGVADTLETAGFDVENRFDVKVSDFKSLQDYQFIVTDCHGSYYKGTPVICTDERVNLGNAVGYVGDLFKNRIAMVTLTSGETNYWIRPSFFDYYYGNDPLNCTVFYLNVCKGALTQDLVNAITRAGADAVVAYSDTVYTYYGTAMLEDIVDALLAGDTVTTAVAEAQTANGANDKVWGNKYGFEKQEIAVCNVYGEDDTILHASLENGYFDADQQGDSIYAWRKYGDARSIYKLSGLDPQSAPRMAIISSGFGSLNGSTTSVIYQTFLVPENANKIVFSYNIVSEEPMEWVGTQYNDAFQAELLSTDGTSLESLAFESVNTSTWYPIDGIDFPGGDETTYHTRWITVSDDAIAAYRGQLVVLRFMVKDAGDSIYDTAALIDSVSIY